MDDDSKKSGEENMLPVKHSSPLKIIWNILTWILVAAVVLLAVLLAGVRVLGYTPYAVLSGSMTPTYQVGDLVYAKAADPETIEIGDPIVFVRDESLTVVTHRVVETDRENRRFYTQGDANDSRDGNPVLYENVVGVVRFSAPKLGYVSNYLQSASGRYVCIAAILIMTLLLILPDIFKKKPTPSDGTRPKS